MLFLSAAAHSSASYMNHQHFMRPFLKRALAWAFAESKRRQVMRCAVDALATQKM
jgi:hypothetical protein